jgi:hypothetical protein
MYDYFKLIACYKSPLLSHVISVLYRLLSIAVLVYILPRSSLQSMEKKNRA